MIEIKEGILWDETPEAVQTEETYQWLRDEVFPGLALDKEDLGVQPKYDKFGRPTEWVVKQGDLTITITRIYTHPEKPMWSKEKDVITIV